MDAGAHRLALGAADLAAAQVAQLAGAQLPDAGVADPHAAAEGQLETGLLACDEDRRSTVAFVSHVGLQDLHGPPPPLARTPADDRLEALEMHPVAVGVLLPVRGERVEQLRWTGEE